MADNTAMGATDTLATDDVTQLNGAVSAGVKVPRAKVGHGADGTYKDASAADPLPVYNAVALPAGTNRIGSVGRTIDGSRTRVTANYTSTTPAAADTLLTLALQKGAASSNVTTIPVTAGKVLRITSIIVGLRTTTAALPYGLATVRINDAAAAVIGTPAAYVVPVSGTAAVIGNTGTTVASIEDGLELTGTAQLAVSFSNNVATNVATISVLGYEYTP